jgi:hypothetical protein
LDPSRGIASVETGCGMHVGPGHLAPAFFCRDESIRWVMVAFTFIWCGDTNAWRCTSIALHVFIAWYSGREQHCSAITTRRLILTAQPRKGFSIFSRSKMSVLSPKRPDRLCIQFSGYKLIFLRGYSGRVMKLNSTSQCQS